MRWSREGDESAHRFTIANAHKDMRYLASMANEVGAVNNLQTLVKNSFAAMEAAGGGQRYVPMLADFVAQTNGLPPASAERQSGD
jgi:3-hydroxyisobutyrate dehydrogenase-like beta-hydroxyacid dehydrogenase